MIKIGDICPLFFNPIKNEFQQDIDYIQRFYTTDRILFQVFSDNSDDVLSCYVKDLITDDIIPVLFSEYQINSETTLYQSEISGLKDSIYKLVVEEENTADIRESEHFSICSDSLLLQETCLIRYSHEDNNSPFDNIFWIGDIQQIFEFRVEGGFKPSGYSAKVDNEQFRNQVQKIVELYSVPYETYTLTCGNASGIPYWIVQFMNNILSLSYFTVNGDMYVRSGNSIPEMTQVSEDGQMFNMTIILEQLDMDTMDTGGIAVEDKIFLTTPELLAINRSEISLSNEDAEKIKKLYYKEGYKKLSVWYGGIVHLSGVINVPISVYSDYFINGEVGVSESIHLAYIDPDNLSKTYTIELNIEDDYSIKAGIPKETSNYALKDLSNVDTSLYAKTDLSNAMTVFLNMNGYAKFNNGLLIQWGTNTGTNQYRTVYFPTSFFNNEYSVVTTSQSPGNVNNVTTFTTDTYSVSSFRVVGAFLGTNGSYGYPGEPFRWFAIGRWK